jgi:Tfp pilus assembly protein PilV
MPRRRKGYTLIEALLAIVVLMIALVGIMGVLALSVVSHTKTNSKRLAVAAAESKVEELRRTSYASLANSTFTVPGLANSAGSVGTVTIATAATDLKKATVRIRWTRPGYGDISFETLFLNN